MALNLVIQLQSQLLTAGREFLGTPFEGTSYLCTTAGSGLGHTSSLASLRRERQPAAAGLLLTSAGRREEAGSRGARGPLLMCGCWCAPDGEVVRAEEQKQLSAVGVPCLSAVAAASLSFSRGEPPTTGNMNLR